MVFTSVTSWPLSVLMSSWMATVLPSTASAHWPER